MSTPATDRAEPRSTAAIADEHDHRALILFGQPIGHRPDDAAVPVRLMQHQRVEFQQRRLLGDLLLRRGEDLIHQQLALIVQAFQLRGENARASEIGRRQQLDREVGIAQAPQRIEARPQPKADVLGREIRGVDLGERENGLQAQALGAAQAIETALQQIARVGGEFGHIGHDAQRHQIEVIVGAIGFAGQLPHLLREFEGHADAGQRTQRMRGGQPLGIDQRVGVGEFVGQIVMIGDEHGDALRPGKGDRFVFGDAGVAGEQHVDALVEQALERIELDAVRFGQALRNVDR